MELSIKTAHILGKAEGQRWSEAVSNDNFFILLEIEPPDSFSATVGEKLLEEILEKLKNAKIESLSDLKNILQSFDKNEQIVTLTIGAIYERVLYLGIVGQGLAVIKRGAKTITLLDKSGTISGFLEDHDLLFISSQSFCVVLTSDKQKEILKKSAFSALAETLTPLILDSPDSSGCAALAISVEKKKEIPEDEDLIIPPAIPQKPLLKLLDFHSFVSKFRLKSVFSESTPETETEKKSKRTLLTVAIILTLLLFLSIFLGINKRYDTRQMADYNKNIDLYSHKIDEAQNLIDLNPIQARSLLSDAQKNLNQLQKNYPKGSSEYKTIGSLLEKVTTTQGFASKVYKLADVPLFFDLSLLKSGGTGTSLSIYKNMLVILDTKNKVAYKLASDTKKADIIAGAETIKDSEFIALHGGNAFVLGSDGVTSIDIGSNVSKLSIKKDDSWGKIADMVAFAGNIYLLDKGKSQVWKYISTDNGFSPRTNYLNTDITPDFSKSQSLSIDGSVWVLTGNDISKFTQGRPDQFSMQGLPNTLVSPAQIFTNDETNNIYLFDKGGGQIILFDKTGTYQEAFQWSGLKSANSFVVSESEKKIFILSGSKIYAIDLK